MTVTIVYGKTSDGYLNSYDANYNTMRNGPADNVVGGPQFYAGQNTNSGYTNFQGFVGFDYSAIPSTEVVTSAALRLYCINVLNTYIAQDVEWYGYGWSGGGLIASDWRTPAQIAASRQDAIVHVVAGSKNNVIQGSSDELLAAMRSVTSMEHVVVTSRQRAGNVPTSDEAINLGSADQAGTVYDPCMVYTSVPRSTLFGVLGAQVELLDGWAWLESNGASTPTITLKYRPFGSATVTTIATLPLNTTGPNAFQIPEGMQGLALVVDPFDNLFILGRLAGSKNTLAVQAWKRGSGVTWNVQTMRSVVMPTYGQSINQVVAIWQNTSGGTITAFVEHVGSAGDGYVHNELQHVMLNAVPIRDSDMGTSVLRGSGYSMPGLAPQTTPSGYFNSWHNETGSGMDLACPAQTGGSTDHGYLFSFGVSQNPGDNRALYEGWYILNGGSTAFYSDDYIQTSCYGRKDAAGKVRVVPVSSQASAFVSTDSDSGWGIVVDVRNHTGSSSTSLGFVKLAAENINAIPDGPTVAQTCAWDVVYSSIENKLWIYYVSSADAGILRRTSIDLNTMKATLSSVVVYDDPGSATITAVRVQRNSSVEQTSLVSIALNASGTLSTAYVVDSFNLAPTAPTLTVKANHDATSAQVYSWTFNDPNSGDAQSAYQLIITNTGTGVVALDTGKVVSGTPSRSVAGSTLSNGNSYSWQVRTWDSSDVVGPYSSLGTFTTSAGGTVSITSPATDYLDGFVTDDIPVTWSASGTTQSAYRIWLYRGSTLVSDSGWVASTATTATVSGMLSDQAHRIDVQVRNAGAVTTNIASRYLTPSFSTPETPTISVIPNAAEGYVSISVENPSPGAPLLGYTEEDFESGVGTWAASTGSTFTQDNAVAHRGTYSGKLTVTVAGQTIYYARDASNRKAVTAGQRYSARAWVYRSVTGDVGVAIDWYDVANAYLSTSSYTISVPANTWTLLVVTGTAPASATKAAYGPTLSASPGSGVYLNMDEVILTAASDRPDVISNDILRREVGSDGLWEVVGTIGPDNEFHDYTATAGKLYEYRARGQA